MTRSHCLFKDLELVLHIESANGRDGVTDSTSPEGVCGG